MSEYVNSTAESCLLFCVEMTEEKGIKTEARAVNMNIKGFVSLIMGLLLRLVTALSCLSLDLSAVRVKNTSTSKSICSFSGQ